MERLSQTGEETVLLTANTTDLCVGHLASEKGKRFLNTNEVGEMKNKFLYFCTGNNSDYVTLEKEIKMKNTKDCMFVSGFRLSVY